MVRARGVCRVGLQRVPGWVGAKPGWCGAKRIVRARGPAASTPLLLPRLLSLLLPLPLLLLLLPLLPLPPPLPPARPLSTRSRLGTFSSSSALGRRARAMRTISKNRSPRLSLSPRCSPAREKDWHARPALSRLALSLALALTPTATLTPTPTLTLTLTLALALALALALDLFLPLTLTWQGKPAVSRSCAGTASVGTWLGVGSGVGAGVGFG